MEKLIRDSEVETKGNVYNKSTQVLAYTDNTVMVGKSLDTLEETVRKLMKASQVMVLRINKQKTKYMEVRKEPTNTKTLKTDDQKYERVKDINLLKLNDIYICRTAALTSRRYILNIYSTNIHTEYFKHAA